MTATTWTWKGGSGLSSVAADWILDSGPGDTSGVPQPGDVVIVPAGIIQDGLDELSGQGSVTIQAGAAISVLAAGDGINLGLNAGTSGTVTVTGMGAQLSVSGLLSTGIVIGDAGNGELLVQNNGSVVGSTMVLGGSADGPDGGNGILALTGSSDVQIIGGLEQWDASTISVDAASGIDLGSSDSFTPGAVSVEAGNQLTGTGTIAAAVVNNGTILAANAPFISATGGSLEITGPISGSGALDIASGATLQLDGSPAPTQSINFIRASPERLIYDAQSGTITSPVVNFGLGDQILFPAGLKIGTAAFQTSGTMTVPYQTPNGTAGDYVFTNFTLAPNTPLSFAQGTDPLTGDSYLMSTRFFAWSLVGASFDNFTSWNLGRQLPGPTDYATLANGFGGTVTGTGTVSVLSFSSGGTWTLASGTTLMANINVAVGNSGGGTNGPGAVVVGGGALLASGGFINVGANAGNVATLTVSSGGTLEGSLPSSLIVAGMYIANAAQAGTLSAASGSVTVTGSGSLLDVGVDALDLASNGGSGSLTVSQGGSAHAASPDSAAIDALSIGSLGNANLTVTDPGSQVTANGVVAIAQGGTSTLLVQNSGTFLAASDPLGQAGVIIGAGGTSGVGGTATATVSTSGVLDSQGGVTVGQLGAPGKLSVLNNGTVQVGTTLAVGFGGTIGNGNTETGDGTLAIGAGGTVTLTGAQRTATYGVYLATSNIGMASTEDAVATVSGAGALLDTDGNGIAVGQIGNATLTVSQGGSVASGSANSDLISALAIGGQGNGTVMVTGLGSQLTASGETDVGAAGTGNLTVQNQASVTIGLDSLSAGGLDIGGAAAAPGGTLYAGGTGTALVSSGGDLFSQAAISVGRDGAAGSLTVQSGGTAEAGTQLLVGTSTDLAQGETVISPAGSEAVALPTAEVGTGLVTVGPSGLVEANGDGISSAGTAAIQIGSGSGATGTLNVSGAGATLSSSYRMDVGSLGQGVLTVSHGGTVLAVTKFAADAAIEIGASAAVAGTVTVTDAGSSIQSTGQIDVGASGSGSLTVENRGTVQSGGSTLAPSQGVDVAQNTGGAGSISVTGPASLLTNNGQFVIGDSGLGILEIASGATVNTTPGAVTGLPGMVIANTESADGSVVHVSGLGSNLNVTGALDVGEAGSGALLLAGGATVIAGVLDGAIESGAVADISLSGANTELLVTGEATVADDGTGVMSVLSGATFSGVGLTIGSLSDSSGALVVSGSGSRVDLTGALNIGTALGTGDLTIGPGAVVDAVFVSLQGQEVLEGGVLDPTVNLINQGQTAGGYGTIIADDIIDEGAIQAGGTKPSQRLLVVEGTVLGGGILSLNGTRDASNPAGSLQINAGGTLELTGAVLNAASTQFTDSLTPTGTYTLNNSVVDVNFNDPAGVLRLDNIAGFDGTITSWQAGDSFVITGGTLSGLGVSNGHTLTVADSASAGGTDSIIFGGAIDPTGFNIVNGNTVQVANEGSVQLACFAKGTRIETETGWAAVESLTAGDTVLTLLGGPGKIVWVGARTVACANHPKPETVWPVRIERGAFGPNLPRRDLYISPDHALYLDGALIPARHLLNGTTIRQVKRRHIVYHHVELARHDVVLAEGLPAESYLDTGDRTKFSGEQSRMRPPEFVARCWEMAGCGELVVTGPRLTAARQRVNEMPGR